jgi:tetratricopeptide (TPR) repeat protein
MALREQGDLPGAAAAFRRVMAESGDPTYGPSSAYNLGVMLARSGDTSGARAAYQRALDAGGLPRTVARAGFNLGRLCDEEGDLAGAQTAYQAALDTGHAVFAPRAALNLGMVLHRLGDASGADVALRTAMQGTEPEVVGKAATNLAGPLAAAGRVTEAEACFRRALEVGYAPALVLYGKLLVHLGREQEAELCFRDGAGRGDAWAMTDLASLLLVRARPRDAGVLRDLGFRPSVAGDRVVPSEISASGFLAADPSTPLSSALAASTVPLAPPEVLEEAERLYRRAIDLGDNAALNDLAALLAGTGREDEAERLFQRAIEAGDRNALTNLAALLVRRDPPAASGHGPLAGQVRDLYERAAGYGETNAMLALGMIAGELGQPDQAVSHFRDAADQGSVPARGLLLLLLAALGHLDEARDRFAQALARNDPRELDGLQTLLAADQPPEVLNALRTARATHDPEHARAFIDLLAATAL